MAELGEHFLQDERLPPLRPTISPSVPAVRELRLDTSHEVAPETDVLVVLLRQIGQRNSGTVPACGRLFRSFALSPIVESKTSFEVLPLQIIF
ncbi:hypothetical protein SR39_02175 [Methylobacterium radiotolerans]|nr:hypothetical protein SR39_02175 [Methylobacterium radiotolerans]